MIARIHGILETVEGDSAIVAVDTALAYQVLLPAYTAARLAPSVGQSITLHTLHYVESHGQGSSLTPRLIGFLTTTDRRFFELFISCRGIGPRKALRAMAVDVGRIAAAIVDRDVALLQSLPEIGRRTAETIIATLRGKVDPFVTSAAYADAVGGEMADRKTPSLGQVQRDALDVLLQLGESRLQAIAWIDQVMQADDPPTNAENLVARVYQIKSGG